MARTMNLLAAISCAALIGFVIVLRLTGEKIFLTLTITFGTIAYHFVMRLVLGLFFNRLMKNKADYTKKWYQVRGWEKRLYELLRVKKWKNRMPSYNPSLFDPTIHTWDEIAQSMCQAELVHETIVLLSLLPMVESIWFGDFLIFLFTSLGGAVIDMMFVIMQRYNRPRVIRMIRHKKQ